MTVLEGRLADRDTWSAVGVCPVEQAMAVVGTRSAMLILREAYYGTTRFDDFAARVGITEASAAGRLRDLTEAGLLRREPYREAGQRTRHEYVLTDAGRDLLPVVLGLFEWGRVHLQTGTRMQLTHHDCGAAVSTEVRCGNGHEVGLDELALRLRPSRHS